MQGRSASSERSASGEGVGQTPNWILYDTVNERAVRIQLECILVESEIGKICTKSYSSPPFVV